MSEYQKIKYKSSEFGVGIGTTVSATTFYEIEDLINSLGLSKSEVVRRLVIRGLAAYRFDGELPPAPRYCAEPEPAVDLAV